MLTPHNCPACGEPSLRLSRRQNFKERLLAHLGREPHVCTSCGRRFLIPVRGPRPSAWVAAGAVAVVILALLVIIFLPAGSPPRKKVKQEAQPVPVGPSPQVQAADDLAQARDEVKRLKGLLEEARQNQPEKVKELHQEIQRLGKENRVLAHRLDRALARAELADRLQDELARLQAGAVKAKTPTSKPKAAAVKKAPKPKTAKPVPVKLPKGYYIQVGSFKTEEAAASQTKSWIKRGYAAQLEPAYPRGKGIMHRVLLGPYPSQNAARAQSLKMKKQGLISGYVLVKR